MAGWISGSESDEEPLNLNLFNRKCFGFLGFSNETINTFKSIVEQLGGSCDSHSKYVFTTKEYYNTLVEKDSSLYNIAFIRDCVDANRYLNVEQYRFSFKEEKRDYRDFDPCCNNFHKHEQSCLICDPSYKKDQANKQRRKSKLQSNQLAEEKQDVQEKERGMKSGRKVNFWEPWECRLLLDYIICHDLFFWVKSASLYNRINAEGFLPHRTPTSMRIYFCKQILPSIDGYDLPKPIKRKFNQVKKAMHPSRLARKVLSVSGKKNKVFVKGPVDKNQVKKPNINKKPRLQT